MIVEQPALLDRVGSSTWRRVLLGFPYTTPTGWFSTLPSVAWICDLGRIFWRSRCPVRLSRRWMSELPGTLSRCPKVAPLGQDQDGTDALKDHRKRYEYRLFAAAVRPPAYARRFLDWGYSADRTGSSPWAGRSRALQAGWMTAGVG